MVTLHWDQNNAFVYNLESKEPHFVFFSQTDHCGGGVIQYNGLPFASIQKDEEPEKQADTEPDGNG